MPALQTTVFIAKGMHCAHCEIVIEQAIHCLPGVREVKADYGAETVEVCFDPGRTDLSRLVQAVELKGYDCSLIQQSNRLHATLKKMAEIVIGLAGIGLIFYLGLWLEEGHGMPLLDQHLSHGMILLVGLLTGFHCVGMCGGLVVGYTVRNERDRKQRHALAHFAYALGKTVSYTLLGAAFGFFGSLITFTPEIRSISAIVAGIFLMLFGLNMLHLFPHLRIFSLRMPAFLNRLVHAELGKHKSPLIIGLLNGLMIACGPLQAMYVMAAGTGSLVEGATILFLFGVGTLPLLMSFGFLASLVSRSTTHRFLQASGVLVLALGLIMLNRGLILGGTGYDFRSQAIALSGKIGQLAQTYAPAGQMSPSGYQIIRMEVSAEGYRPDHFVLKKGIPVKWIILGKELTSCNRGIVVPKLGLTIELHEGEQVIEFTPQEEGVIPWSCWMGMIPGSFVIESF